MSDSDDYRVTSNRAKFLSLSDLEHKLTVNLALAAKNAKIKAAKLLAPFIFGLP
jgi:hypothetical protein